jgi:hypothetical protein
VNKLTKELEKELRATINPKYINQRGTESWERALLFAEIDALRDALQYGIDIHTPGRIDGPGYHHEKMFLGKAKAAMRK